MKELLAFLQVTTLLLTGALLENTLRTRGLVADEAFTYLACFIIICAIYLRQLNKE